MKKLLLLTSLIGLSAAVWAEDPSAVDQMHEAMIHSLANTEYYDEYHKGDPNAHRISTTDNLAGEAEYMRDMAGHIFDKGSTPMHKENWKEGNPNWNPEYYYIVNPKTGEKVIMKNPAYRPEAEQSMDDMFMDAIGGDAAVNASNNSNYQGDYQTEVGGRTEREGFDLELAKQAAKNANKQAAADQHYRDIQEGNTFWQKVGRAAAQGMAQMAADFPEKYAEFQKQQAEKKRAIDAYNAQVDAYNKAQWQNYYNQVNAQNSGSSSGGSSYSRPAAPQLSPAQQCEQRCRNTGSPHLHHRGSHYSGGVCQCDVCDDRIQKC